MRYYFYTGIIAICLSIAAPAQATQDDSQKPLPQIQLLIRNANMITELCSSSYDNGGEIKGAACTLKNTIFIYLQEKGWCINDNAPTKNQWQPCKGKGKEKQTISPNNWKIVTHNYNSSIINNDPKAKYRLIIERSGKEKKIIITLFLRENYESIIVSKNNTMIKFYQETNNTPSEYKYIYKTNDTHIYELLSSNKPATLIVNDNRQNFSLQIPKDVLEVFKTKIAQEPTSSVEDIIQNNNKYDKPTGSNALGKQALQQLGDGACHNDMNRLTDVVATCFIQYNNKQADLDLCILEDLYVNLAASHASKNGLTPETIRSPFGISITGKGGLYGNAFLSIAAQNTRSKSYYYKKFNNITEINSYFEPDLSYIKENIANYNS